MMISRKDDSPFDLPSSNLFIHLKGDIHSSITVSIEDPRLTPHDQSIGLSLFDPT